MPGQVNVKYKREAKCLRRGLKVLPNYTTSVIRESCLRIIIQKLELEIFKDESTASSASVSLKRKEKI